ncbi:ABC transporter transmembrane domain-containing protein, partial [Georgenia sp. 10Sc9-8]|nr:ABC transporter transmembrane domain-containing protein [Georgenia halotolerans]
LCLAVVVGTTESLCAAAIPFLLGRTVDAGLVTGVSRELLVSAALLLAVGVAQALASALAHIAEVGGWLHGTFTTSRLVGHHVTRTGPAVGDELATGEVVSTVASDAFHVGNMLEVLPKLVGGMVAYAAVALVLLRDSVALGLAVLLGLPLVSLVLALVIRPLHARQAAQREAAGRLATLGSDTVSGLRVLRGIGGEDVFAGRYRAQSQRVRQAGVGVAATQSVLEALQVLLPVRS